MDFVIGAGALGALIAGATGSLHCALMCGPLACAAGGTSRAAAASWHLGRLLSYAALGTVLGASGSAALQAWLPGAQPALPWLMAAGLIATALDLGRHLKPLPGVRHLSSWLVKTGAGFAPAARAGAMGAATPFLPCGLVYGMALAALGSGSAFGGFAVMGAFALGAVPLLAATQAQAGLWRRHARLFAVARRAVPLLAAGVLVWRALGAHSDAPPDHCH